MEQVSALDQAARRAGELLADAAPGSFTEAFEGSGQRYIKAKAVPPLAEALQAVVAEVVASLINAGSERDAVMENEELRAELANELWAWGGPEGANHG